MIRLIAAIDQQRGIAKGGVQPWLLPADEQYFRDQTLKSGGVILMGQKTFEAIEALGRHLPDRRKFVLSRESRTGDGVTYIQDLDQFFNQQHEDVWVIGGESLFQQTIPAADELVLTIIQATFGCDQLFPEYEHVFELAETSELHTENGFIYTHNRYKKL